MRDLLISHLYERQANLFAREQMNYRSLLVEVINERINKIGALGIGWIQATEGEYFGQRGVRAKIERSRDSDITTGRVLLIAALCRIFGGNSRLKAVAKIHVAA